MASSKLIELETNSSASPSKSSKTKKDKSGKKIRASTTVQATSANGDVPEDTTIPSSMSKEDKSSKKRKATASVETTPADVESLEDSIHDPSIASRPKSRDAEDNAGNDNENAQANPDVETRPNKKRRISVEEIEVDITAPEPPSKKALRLLKKGKPLPPSKSGADSPEPSSQPEKKKSEVEKRSEHGIWIGNLPWSVSKEKLREFFVEYSDITDDMITRVYMPGPDDKKSANKVEERKFGKPVHNKGFAYVDFSSQKAVEWAIELSEQLLQGRRVLIKDNKSFEGRPLKTKEESRNDGKPPSKKVFLGNLAFDCTEESLKEHFEKCGAIESIKVATFEDTGKCKGYAWITFEELEAAMNAVRGYIMVAEESSDTSDSESYSGSDREEASNGESKKTIKPKMRKQWCNRIKGRPLKQEFAEDAGVRYKKRYGKEGTKRVAGDASGEEAKENRLPAKVVPAVKVEYRQSYAPRLTGGIVESKGKKTTF